MSAPRWDTNVELPDTDRRCAACIAGDTVANCECDPQATGRPAPSSGDGNSDSVTASSTVPAGVSPLKRMMGAAFAPEKLSADAAAFDRAADALRRIGMPGGDLREDAAAYRRGVEYGHMLSVMRLRELARARRELAREIRAKTWEANVPTDRPAA